MGETPQGMQLEITTVHESEVRGHNPFPNEENIGTSTAVNPLPKSYTWWIRVSIYSFFVIAGQAVATLLGRLYFEKGRTSKWLATFIQLGGFPLLIPLYCFVVVKSRIELKQTPGLPPPMNLLPFSNDNIPLHSQARFTCGDLLLQSMPC